MRRGKLRVIIAVVGLMLLLSACATDASRKVESMITDLGSITEESYPDISTARSAFEQLSDKEKKYVSNIGDLEAAEKQYDILCAQHVDNLILQIGDIDIDSKEAIDAARQGFENLTREQKQLVKYFDMLLEAESDYPVLVYKTAKELFNQLETADPSDTERYEYAEKVYNLLTDDQKDELSKEFRKDADQLDLVQMAQVLRVQKLITQISYEKGTPNKDQLNELVTVVEAFINLSDNAKACVANKADLDKALKEFIKFADNRTKTDKLYARSVYISNCTEVPFDELMMYPKSYKDKTISIEIQVDEIATGLLNNEIKAHVPGEESRILLKDNRNVMEPAFKVDEIVTVYGTFEGTKSITLTEEGSGLFGSNLFGNVTENYDVPVIEFVYASNDNPGVIADGDPSAKDISLDPETEEMIEWLKDAVKQIKIK